MKRKTPKFINAQDVVFFCTMDDQVEYQYARRMCITPERTKEYKYLQKLFWRNAVMVGWEVVKDNQSKRPDFSEYESKYWDPEEYAIQSNRI